MNAPILEARSTRPYKLKSISKWLCLLFMLGWLSVPAVTGDEPGNGITVGEPKVFDNRSLASMIEQFEESLSASGLSARMIWRLRLETTRDQKSETVLRLYRFPLRRRRK
jgi:hypothetical protein